MEQPHHRVTIVIDTDDNKRLQDILRVIYGLQGILAPDVQLDFATELNDFLVEREELKDQARDDEPF